MHVHLEYVRALLAASPATRPELEARRGELLGYLGDYIAKGITPANTYVAHRSPVFIDARGNVCAVGYLIERSVGRDLPEKIAATHRLDYLEDIAAAMPEVSDWVATSGFTLDELASIQPGYMGPEVQHADGFVKDDMPDGDYKVTDGDDTVTGKFAKHQMTGEWKRTTAKGAVVGSGTFKGGSGTWTTFFPDGTKMAKGEYDASRADGDWKIYHPSGRVAAQGAMHKGRRDGAWTFFYDAKGSPKLSVGKFDKGETVGTWKHYDAGGKLVATASGHPWDHLMLSVEPGKDGVRHDIDQGEPADSYRLDAFYLGKDKLYIRDRAHLYDGDANLLIKVDGAWTAQACKWSKARARAARNGDTAALYASFLKDHWEAQAGDDKGDTDGECTGEAKAVATAKANKIDAMLASRAQIDAPIPPDSFAATTDTERVHYEDEDSAPITGKDDPKDMATYLADYMVWYVEWPHIDDPFIALYASLPGHKTLGEEFSPSDAKVTR